MLQDKKYDFSEESDFKARLLEKLLTEYKKTAIQGASALCEDQLDLVAAAGTQGFTSLCPYSTPCRDCCWYQSRCLKMLTKCEGGEPRV